MKVNRKPRALAMAMTLCVLAPPGQISPATIVVDGDCSLSDAIVAANTDSSAGSCSGGSGADEIQLTADVALVSALPAITTDVVLAGNGFEIRREADVPAFRILEITNQPEVVIDSVILSNGDAGTEHGGGVFFGSGVLSMINSTVSENSAATGGGLYVGFGVSATLVGTSVSGNSAESGGGIYSWWGYVDVTEGSAVSGNLADDTGGGLHIQGYASLDVIRSTISNNTAGGSGGGIFVSDAVGSFDAHPLALIESTISNNRSGADGGGVRWHGGAYGYGAMRIENTTVSGNGALRGGGVFHASGRTVTLVGSTLVGNSAFEGAAFHSVGGYFSGGPIATASILAHSHGSSNCGGQEILAFSDSFSDDGSCSLATDIRAGIDFEVGLADNGGPTRTHALTVGSVALDAGGDCGLSIDQRGLSRSDGKCDSGSVESSGVALAVSGSCPGPIEITVSASDPEQTIALFAGGGGGVSVVGSGICAGTGLDLENGRPWRRVNVDDSGQMTFTGVVSASWCGRSIQALDRLCRSSNVVPLQ